ncbi:MAG: phage portal protein, partial [Desulfurellales bacterium]
MFNRIAQAFGYSKPAPPAAEDRVRAMYQTVRALKAKYDAAQTTDDNTRHWQWADDMSAVSANNPAVRKVLRKRSRYEVANNCYARGLTLTLANDCIGTGPRLQLLTPNKDANRLIERAFAQWAKAVGLAGKLRTMRMAKVQDGESFAVITTNPKLRSPVKLDIRVIEADRVATPYGTLLQETARAVDGITFDEYGNPSQYTILRAHPGEASIGGYSDADSLPADVVIHWFRSDRPGQARAVPEITAALPLFAMLRDFKIATLDAAKAAAAVSFVLKTV